MARGGTIEYGVKFNVDKSSLNDINTYLNQIQKMGANNLTTKKIDNNTIEQIKEIKQTAATIQTALQKAFNVKLNSTNLTAFNKELQKSGLTIEKIYQQFSSVGATGSAAFKSLTSSLLTTNLELKESQTLLDKIATTMGNTIK
jgi:hypothetical protein